jgi:hypothetical protein
MASDRLKAYRSATALNYTEQRRIRSDRAADPWTEVSPGGPPYRLLWCRITSGAPGNPPDERYYADEVRPTGVDGEGRLEWEPVPDGLAGIVVHNTAETGLGTHALAEEAVIRVEERLDRSGPPEMVYLAHVPVPQERLARIISYAAGAYTVQPVRRQGGGFVDDGSPIASVPNLGELWDDEKGYLAGPTGFDRYVRIFRTPAGWILLLHPPRMV